MTILSIGGSDPSSGAGIQSDIRVAEQLGTYCLTILTAITSQNTRKYSKTFPLPAKTVQDQIESILSDCKIDVIKVGMLYNIDIIDVLYTALKPMNVPVIVDPVMNSTTGGLLLKNDALDTFYKKIVPLSHAITPNIEEAEAISGIKFTGDNAEDIASKIIKMGAKNIIITGIIINDTIVDYTSNGSKNEIISTARMEIENHGGGCAFSAALAIAVARGLDIFKAARFAGKFAKNSITNAKSIGGGIKITNGQEYSSIIQELKDGILKFTQINGIYRAIPECQTNFAFSKSNPSNIMDVAGVTGRIVRAGNGTVIAGSIEFGGSKHVATAILEMNKRFPDIRAGINIRYDPDILAKSRSEKMTITEYDRSIEPKDTRINGSSVSWGTRTAIAGANIAPDIIFHQGGYGKEPMIIIFGQTPDDIIGKIRRIF